MVNNKFYSTILFIAVCAFSCFHQIEAAPSTQVAPAAPVTQAPQKTKAVFTCTASSCGKLKEFQKCLANPDFKVEEHPNCMQAALNAIRGLSLTSIATENGSDATRKALPEGLYSLLTNKAPWMLPQIRSKDFGKTHDPDLNVLPGCPILICSFDGGGVKGIIPATIIADIEQQIGLPITEICDIFVGTSTGGLIALFLTTPNEQGKQKYSAGEMVNLYKALATKVFKNSWRRGVFVSKYSADSLMKLLQEYLGYNKISGAVKPLVVTSYDLKNKAIFPIATRYGVMNPKMDLFLYEAGRATSAAPTFFPAFDVTLSASIKLKLADGGLMANNPGLLAWLEAKKIYAGRSYTVLSLGTGDYNNPKTPTKSGVIAMLAPTVEALFKGPMQLTHEAVQASVSKGNYYRFSPTLNKQQDAMDNAESTNMMTLEAVARDQVLESEAYKSFVKKIKKELLLKKYLKAIVKFIGHDINVTYTHTLKEMNAHIQNEIQEGSKDLESAYRAKHYFQKTHVLAQAHYIPDLSIRKAFINWIINEEPGFEWVLMQVATEKVATLEYIEAHPEDYTALVNVLKNPETIRNSVATMPTSSAQSLQMPQSSLTSSASGKSNTPAPVPSLPPSVILTAVATSPVSDPRNLASSKLSADERKAARSSFAASHNLWENASNG